MRGTALHLNHWTAVVHLVTISRIRSWWPFIILFHLRFAAAATLCLYNSLIVRSLTQAVGDRFSSLFWLRFQIYISFLPSQGVP